MINHVQAENASVDFATGFSWSLDFCRAVRQRPWWARWLYRLVVGRYAYREFIGMQDALARESFNPYFDYSCENVSYHADEVPLKWWIEREPLPLK